MSKFPLQVEQHWQATTLSPNKEYKKKLRFAYSNNTSYRTEQMRNYLKNNEKVFICYCRISEWKSNQFRDAQFNPQLTATFSRKVKIRYFIIFIVSICLALLCVLRHKSQHLLHLNNKKERINHRCMYALRIVNFATIFLIER